MTKKNVLTADALTKIKTREVEVGGGVVVIKQMTAAYAMEIREASKANETESTFKLISDLMVEPSLTIEQVKEMPTDYLRTISLAIADFNGISPDAVSKAETELKNARTEGSTIN